LGGKTSRSPHARFSRKKPKFRKEALHTVGEEKSGQSLAAGEQRGKAQVREQTGGNPVELRWTKKKVSSTCKSNKNERFKQQRCRETPMETEINKRRAESNATPRKVGTAKESRKKGAKSDHRATPRKKQRQITRKELLGLWGKEDAGEPDRHCRTYAGPHVQEKVYPQQTDRRFAPRQRRNRKAKWAKGKGSQTQTKTLGKTAWGGGRGRGNEATFWRQRREKNFVSVM